MDQTSGLLRRTVRGHRAPRSDLFQQRALKPRFCGAKNLFLAARIPLFRSDHRAARYPLARPVGL